MFRELGKIFWIVFLVGVASIIVSIAFDFFSQNYDKQMTFSVNEVKTGEPVKSLQFQSFPPFPVLGDTKLMGPGNYKIGISEYNVGVFKLSAKGYKTKYIPVFLKANESQTFTMEKAVKNTKK